MKNVYLLPSAEGTLGLHSKDHLAVLRGNMVSNGFIPHDLYITEEKIVRSGMWILKDGSLFQAGVQENYDKAPVVIETTSKDLLGDKVSMRHHQNADELSLKFVKDYIRLYNEGKPPVSL